MEVKIKVHLRDSIEFNKIDKNIYIGTNQCCRYHFKKDLLSKGVSADISLEEDRVDAPFGVKSYLWLPTKDQTAPSQDQIMLGVEHLKKLISENKKVYVHCEKGHGRAPTLVAAYYATNGMKPKEAIDFVESKRPGAHINEKQQKAIRAFVKSIR